MPTKMASQDGANADEARQRGNELYKKGRLVEAEREYQKAATLAPSDPTPLSNLSSVKFEMGQYSDAIKFILKSLQLASEAGTDQSDEASAKKKRTLYERLAKCYVHESRFDDARGILTANSDADLPLDSVLGNLDALAAWRASKGNWNEDVAQHRSLMFERIPRFMSHMTNTAEYYAVGHDTAESLFDDQLRAACSPSDSVALMFCGSGDARNVFATLMDMFFQETVLGKKKRCKNIHITILDLKAAAIARTLIFFDMMVVYMSLKARKTPGIEDAPIIMAYLFAGHVVPAAVNEKLQAHIKGLLPALETDEPIHGWLFVPQATRKQVAHVLRRWQNPPKARHYQPGVIRRTVMKRMALDRLKSSALTGSDHREETKPGLEEDQKSFRELGVILPSNDFAKRRDEQLIALMKDYRRGGKDAKEQLASHIDNNWDTNLTFLDFDFAEAGAIPDHPGYLGMPDEEKVPAIESDPTEVVKRLPELVEKAGVLETLGQFFDITTLTLTTFARRLMIEALVGEMTDTMDRLRWNCFESRLKPSGGIDPSTFPRTYDRIHMSNIPDYVGGLFTPAMYARPLLREDRDSNLRYTVLLNPPEFASHEHFHAESLLLHREKHIQDHFSMVRLPDYYGPKVGGPTPEMLEQMRLSFPDMTSLDFMSEGYIVWGTTPTRKLSRDTGLLPRPALDKWLYGFFLKITLPYPRPVVSGSPVYSPLNLSSFIRLISHLADLGYPAHWLSSILAGLCTGTISTTARPPQRRVCSPSDVDAASVAQQVVTAPWVAQFTTLLSIWSKLLPFGLITPPGTLVSPSQVAEFVVSIPFVLVNEQPRVPQFVLLFWRVSKEKVLQGHQLHQVLCEKKKSTLKSDAMHVVTVMEWDDDECEAKFWCREDAIEGMKKEGGWEVFILRTDNWTLSTMGVKVKEVELKRRWSD